MPLNKTQSKLIQTWSPYNESAIWTLANEYYQHKGIKAFKSDAVPHSINTNYPNARALAELVKANIINYPSDYTLTVLECGAGSGYFSLNLLTAIKDLGLSERVKLLISDYTSVNLEEIDKLNMLKDFEKGKHYEFIELDVLKPNSIKVSTIILNYVLDALPVTVLRKSKIGFEELYVKLECDENINYDPLNNPSLLKDLSKQYQWQSYKTKEQSDLEQKYLDSFSRFHVNTRMDKNITYSYSALYACENLLDTLDESGFIFSCDIPTESTYFCQIVGNALAHEVDNNLLAKYFEQKNFKAKVQIDKIVSRLILAKESKTLSSIEPSFQEHYINNNLVNRYSDLREILIKFTCKESTDIMKMVLEEFDKLDKNSPYSGIYWGNYHGLMGNNKEAILAYKEAQRHDYIGNYNLQQVINNLEK